MKTVTKCNPNEKKTFEKNNAKFDHIGRIENCGLRFQVLENFHYV